MSDRHDPVRHVDPPPAPSVAAEVFAGSLPLAERYTGWLAGAGIARGLLGPRETPRLWDRHVLNSALLASLVPAGASVADLGSGAGLPGIPIALRRADATVTLVEPLLRRVDFLQEVVADLVELDPSLGPRLEVLRSRAEDLHGSRRFTVVTARALAPLDRLLDWGMPLVEPGGVLLALKGGSARDEVSASIELQRQRLEAEVVELDEPAGAITVVVVRRHPDKRG